MTIPVRVKYIVFYVLCIVLLYQYRMPFFMKSGVTEDDLIGCTAFFLGKVTSPTYMINVTSFVLWHMLMYLCLGTVVSRFYLNISEMVITRFVTRKSAFAAAFRAVAKMTICFLLFTICVFSIVLRIGVDNHSGDWSYRIVAVVHIIVFVFVMNTMSVIADSRLVFVAEVLTDIIVIGAREDNIPIIIGSQYANGMVKAALYFVQSMVLCTTLFLMVRRNLIRKEIIGNDNSKI